MNWTGGRLHRHSKSRANQIIRTQKEYFARARIRSSGRPTNLDCIDYSFSRNPGLNPIQDIDNELDEPSRETEQARGNQVSHCAERESQITAAGFNLIDVTRHNLLNRKDWSSISATKPLQMDFSHQEEMKRLGRHKKARTAESPNPGQARKIVRKNPSGHQTITYLTRESDLGRRQSSSSANRRNYQRKTKKCGPRYLSESASPQFHADRSSGSLLIESFEEAVNKHQVLPSGQLSCEEQSSDTKTARYPLDMTNYSLSWRESGSTDRKSPLNLGHAVDTHSCVSPPVNTLERRKPAEHLLESYVVPGGGGSGLDAVSPNPVYLSRCINTAHPTLEFESSVFRQSDSPGGMAECDNLHANEFSLLEDCRSFQSTESQRTRICSKDDRVCVDLPNHMIVSNISESGDGHSSQGQSSTPASSYHFRDSPLVNPATLTSATISGTKSGPERCLDDAAMNRKCLPPDSKFRSPLSLLTTTGGSNYTHQVDDGGRSDDELWVKCALAEDFERVQMEFEFRDTPRRRQSSILNASRWFSRPRNFKAADVSDPSSIVSNDISGSSAWSPAEEAHTSVSRNKISSYLVADSFEEKLRSNFGFGGSLKDATKHILDDVSTYDSNKENRSGFKEPFTLSTSRKQLSAIGTQRRTALENQRKRKIAKVYADSIGPNDVLLGHRKTFSSAKQQALFDTPRKHRLELLRHGANRLAYVHEDSTCSPLDHRATPSTQHRLHYPSSLNHELEFDLGSRHLTTSASIYSTPLQSASSKHQSNDLPAPRLWLQYDLRCSTSSIETDLISSSWKHFDSHPQALKSIEGSHGPGSQHTVLTISEDRLEMPSEAPIFKDPPSLPHSLFI